MISENPTKNLTDPLTQHISDGRPPNPNRQDHFISILNNQESCLYFSLPNNLPYKYN